MLPRFELYRGGFLRRDWRWRFRAVNGRTIFISSEGYHNKADAVHAIRLAKGCGLAEIVEV